MLLCQLDTYLYLQTNTHDCINAQKSIWYVGISQSLCTTNQSLSNKLKIIAIKQENCLSESAQV